MTPLSCQTYALVGNIPLSCRSNYHISFLSEHSFYEIAAPLVSMCPSLNMYYYSYVGSDRLGPVVMYHEHACYFGDILYSVTATVCRDVQMDHNVELA